MKLKGLQDIKLHKKQKKTWVFYCTQCGTYNPKMIKSRKRILTECCLELPMFKNRRIKKKKVNKQVNQNKILFNPISFIHYFRNFNNDRGNMKTQFKTRVIDKNCSYPIIKYSFKETKETKDDHSS